MLNKLDDYPIHQTPEPIAHPATSDRNAYDRTWFNGYAADGSYYFGIGMAIYPHRGILDCAFSVVRKDGAQYCFYGSRRAPSERTEMQVGPMQIEVIEPMRAARVQLQPNDSGISCDLTFTARTTGLQEARQVLWQQQRRVMDATRFAQFGRWSGWVDYAEGRIDVNPAECYATKDRSWGVRGVGEAESGGAPVNPNGICFIWAPLIWDDHVSHAIFFDGPQGEALVREGFTAPLYDDASDIPRLDESPVTRMATAVHRISYHPQSRLARYAELDLIDLHGGVRTITMEPILRFHMKGLGYGHPKWKQGSWQGELETGGEVFDPQTLNLLSPENFHTQQVVRVSDGERSGMGVLEQIVVGPYEPAGFKEFFDGAKV